MNTPKPHPPVSATKHDEVVEANMAALTLSPELVAAMKDQLREIRDSKSEDTPKPKARPKPKGAYSPKNQPLKDHPGLVALKNNLEKR